MKSNHKLSIFVFAYPKLDHKFTGQKTKNAELMGPRNRQPQNQHLDIYISDARPQNTRPNNQMQS